MNNAFSVSVTFTLGSYVFSFLNGEPDMIKRSATSTSAPAQTKSGNNVTEGEEFRYTFPRGAFKDAIQLQKQPSSYRFCSGINVRRLVR